MSGNHAARKVWGVAMRKNLIVIIAVLATVCFSVIVIGHLEQGRAMDKCTTDVCNTYCKSRADTDGPLCYGGGVKSRHEGTGTVLCECLDVYSSKEVRLSYAEECIK